MSARLAAIAGDAGRALDSAIDIDALHAAALIDLAAADSSGNSADRAVSYLEMITRLDPQRGSAWTDLSAALLVRAVTRRDGRSLVAALDAATNALELDSALAAASYNRAIALDQLSLDAEAVREWRRYLSGRRRPRSAFAHAALATSEAVRDVPRPLPEAAADSMGGYAARRPFDARFFAWEALLGGWGAAILAGDTATAAARLTAAAVIADTLVRQFGDSSLVSAVASIRATDAGRRRALAALHVAYATGRAQTVDNDHVPAERAFAGILAAPAAPPALRDWAALAHANSALYLRRADAAVDEATRLLGRLHQDAHPSLAGRAWWLVAVVALRQGRDGAGLAATAHAREMYQRAGEVDNIAATFSLLGERALRLGDDEGFSTVIEAMRTLRPFPSGQWRHNALYILATNATRVGLDRAAMTFNDEDAASASGNRAATVAEIRLIRARALWERGDTARALAALDQASRTIAELPNAQLRDAFRAELSLTQATGPQAVLADSARRLLDGVVAWYAPARQATRLIPAYVGRAGAALHAGRGEAAEADLARAAELYASQRDSIGGLPERAALLARARDVHARLALLRWSAGDTTGALAAIEDGRNAFAVVRSPATRRPAAASDSPVLDLALVGDTLLAWWIERGTVTGRRAIVPADSVRVVVERVRAGMELSATEASMRRDLSRLYDWLLRPVGEFMGRDSSTVGIVSDGSLADVPFAALVDTASGRYVVDTRPTRWLPTMSFARASRGSTGQGRALIVANPAIDARMFPSLTPLPGAVAESRTVASFLGSTVLLEGQAADSASVVSGLRSASHFHFAGHAVFDDARPHRSRLALLPRGIDASSLAAMDLRRLELVVLSACETTRAPERRGAGYAGLAEAFLAAGAGGVIGTLWRVGDAPTAEFMTGFYRAYRETADAAVALRAAQLHLRRSADPGRRSPSAWGAFRLAGR